MSDWLGNRQMPNEPAEAAPGPSSQGKGRDSSNEGKDLTKRVPRGKTEE